jgi:hypothetical protein
VEDSELDCFFEQPLIAALGEEEYANEQTLGAVMTLEEIVRLARSLAQG